MRYLVLCCFIIGTVQLLEVHHNVIFQKVNEITTTKSQWKVALVMDISTFGNVLDKLNTNIENAEQIAHQILNRYNVTEEVARKSPLKSPDTEGFSGSIRNLRTEIEYLKELYQDIFQSYLNYQSLSGRSKRSFLPLGGLFRVLFGTAEDSDVAALKHNVVKLAKTQKSIVHILESNLSILNVSRGEISQNRQSINKIVSSLHDIDDKINKMNGRMEKQIGELQEYSLLYHNLNLVIDEVRQMIRQAQFHLQDFERQLNMLSLSRLSPSIITPNYLKSVFNEIMSQLPPTFVLPAEPETHLWDFYKILKCDTILYDNQIAILINIPLLDLDGKLNVYRIHNLDIPYYQAESDQSPISESPVEMTAKYDIDTPGILVNTERTRYAILSAAELVQCSDSITKFCNVESAMYQISLSERCSIALFTRNEGKISKFCHTMVNPNNKLPMARYIYKGHWVITTNIPLRFVVVCHSNDKKKSEITVKPPMDFIYLNMNCRGFNEYLALNAWFDQTSTKNVPTSNDLATFPNITKMIIWAPFHSAIKNISKIQIPQKLQEVKQIPMNDLIQNLKLLENVNLENTSWPNWYYIVIAIIATLIVLLGIFVYCKYFKQFCTRSANNDKRFRDTKDHTVHYRLTDTVDLGGFQSTNQPQIPVGNMQNIRTDANPPTPVITDKAHLLRQLYPSLQLGKN